MDSVGDLFLMLKPVHFQIFKRIQTPDRGILSHNWLDSELNIDH